jgi:hypothetical protein
MFQEWEITYQKGNCQNHIMEMYVQIPTLHRKFDGNYAQN